MPSAAELINFAEQLIIRWGIWLIPIGAFLENSIILGFIFPGVTVIFLSGFVARTSGENLFLIILLATLGSFLGDNFDYLIGKRAGKVLEEKPLFAKPVSLVEPFLLKHGIWAVFAGRFSAWSRAWIALACGIIRFKYWKFALVSAASALIWTSAWIIGGYLMAGNRKLIEEWFDRASDLVILGLLVLIIYYFRTRLKLIFDLVVYFIHKTGKRVVGKVTGNDQDRGQV
ncbi:DedA family protein [Candidatus Curtissbacteria bacterium]|nr:DedA family protein [Candidatus Curtissbacteria bacterium]